MSQDPSNERIAETFVKVAELLQAQSASPFRVRAWREGAATVRAEARPLAEVFRTDGRAGLEAIPNIDARLANVIIELVRTGHARILDRLQGEVSPTGVFAELPGVGAALAGRINRELGIETLEELERAAHDGRLAALAGFGERRVRAVCDILAARPSRPSLSPAPPAALLLEMDRRYHDLDSGGQLRRIAPRRFNPAHKAWLPILHEERNGWDFTVLYSNTALAHDLGKTHDWVVVTYERDGDDGHATVVTETRGPLRGMRVVRGREAESAAIYASTPAAQDARAS